MNSARLVSLADRVAVARVAGKALGTMVVEVRLRGEVITREAIDTGYWSALVARVAGGNTGKGKR